PLMVTVSPGLQVGPFNVLTGPTNVGLNGAVAIAPAVATAPPATAPAVLAVPVTGSARTEVSCCVVRFTAFFFAANAGEMETAAMTAQQAIVLAFIGVPPIEHLPTSFEG